MNDVYQKLAGAVRLWQIEEAANVSSDIDVTEAWYSHDTDRVTVQDHHVVAAELSEWLQRTTRPSNTGVKTLVMRLVWVRVDPEKRHFSVSKPTRKALLKAFGLGLAYDYFQSFVTGVTKFPEETTAYGPREAYAFSYAPKLAAIWSSSYRPPPFRCGTLTQGLIFVREPARSTQLEERVIQTLRESLTHTWDAGLLCHPLFPAYLLALLLGIQIDLTQQGIKKRLQGLEKRTGYHGFASRREEEATGVFQELSVTASGWITKLASVERKSKTIDQLLTLISKQSNTQEKEAINLNSRTERGHGTVSGTVTLDTVHLLKSQTDVLKHRHDMQVLDNQYIVKRVEIQIQAVSTLQIPLLTHSCSNALPALPPNRPRRDHLQLQTLPAHGPNGRIFLPRCRIHEDPCRRHHVLPSRLLRLCPLLHAALRLGRHRPTIQFHRGTDYPAAHAILGCDYSIDTGDVCVVFLVALVSKEREEEEF